MTSTSSKAAILCSIARNLVEDRLGNKRWHVTTKVPIRSKDERITGLVGISRDITERKLAEEAIRSANEGTRAQQGRVATDAFRTPAIP